MHSLSHGLKIVSALFSSPGCYLAQKLEQAPGIQPFLAHLPSGLRIATLCGSSLKLASQLLQVLLALQGQAPA